MANVINLTGQTFGRLTVIKRDYSAAVGRATWVCICTCGTTKSISSAPLRKGLTTSCGCFHKEQLAKRAKTHGLSNSPEYESWSGMKRRCADQNSRYYKNGITVCDAWNKSFEAFFNDMGRKPSPIHSIDRINNSGHYTPENCRWATPIEQANNTKNVRHLTANKETMSLSAWARKLNTSPSRLHYLLKNRSMEDVINHIAGTG